MNPAPRFARTSASLAALAFLVSLTGAQVPAGEPSTLPPLEVDVTILTRDGRVPDEVEPAALAVSLDGTPRRVTWVRRLSRGPGALADAARRAARGTEATGFAAEAVRTVVVALDAGASPRGDSAVLVEAASGLLDRLGLNDRVAVVVVPFAGEPHLEFHDDPPATRDALAKVARGLPAESARDSTDVLTSMRALAASLRATPGRKVVALFSPGLPAIEGEPLGAFAAEAAAARVTVAAVGRQAPSRGSPSPAESTGLGRLSTVTGGPLVTLGRELSARDMDRLATELSAAFVIGFERLATDQPGERHDLRVDVLRRDLVVRGAARWFVPVDDDDVGVAVAKAAAGMPVATGSPAPVAGLAGVPADAATGELAVALDRLTDYVDTYERLASVLVAEEDYRQRTPRQQVRLRSDVLMVKPPGANEWVSFRDVFEADGTVVREREDRLKRLFLDGTPGARAQLQAIKAESSRYNIGPFERDINVPYLALKFVRPVNLGRHRFVLKGGRKGSDVAVWRVEFDEVARPTIIRDMVREDVPATGWFLVDRITGAVVESGLSVSAQQYEVQIVVRYRRDPALGLWVPERMEETYKARRPGGAISNAQLFETVLRGTATYAKFRRFRVVTDEQLSEPK